MSDYSSPSNPSQFPTMTPAPTPDPAPVQTSNGGIWGDIGAGGYEALNQVGFGLPDLLVNTANSQAYQNLKKLREEHPEAAMAGGLAGNIGSMFIPGMGAVKGVQTASKLGNLALQGGLMGAKQSVPRAVMSGALDVEQGKDLGETVKDRASEAAIGTAAGAALNPVAAGAGSLVAKGADKLGQLFGRQMGNSLNLGIGVKDSDIISKLEELSPSSAGKDAYVQSRVKDFQQGLAQYAKQNKITSSSSLDKFLADEKAILEPIAKTWDVNPPLGQDMFKKLLSDPKVDALVQSGAVTPAQISQIGLPLINKAGGKMGSYWDVLHTIENQMSNASTIARNATDLKSLEAAKTSMTLLGSMKRAINDTARNLPGVSQEARDRLANWDYRDVLVNASKGNSAMESASNTGGEGGFNRFGNAALGSYALGGALGAGGGALSDGKIDPLTGGLVGMGASMAFPRVIPNAMSAIQAKIGALGTPMASKATQGSSRLQALQAKLPSAAGAMAPDLLRPNTPPPVSAQPTAQVGGLPTDVVASRAPVNMGGEMVKPKGELKVNLNSPFGQRLIGSMNRMFTMYTPTDNGKPMSRQDLFDWYSSLTGGFDPSNEATIKLMTNNPEEQQLLQSTIPKVNQLRGINFDKLADRWSNNIGDVEGQDANNRFVRLLAELNSKDPAKIPSQNEINQAQDMVNKIRWGSGSDAQKKSDFLNLLGMERGLQLNKLKALGLTEGLY